MPAGEAGMRLGRWAQSANAKHAKYGSKRTREDGNKTKRSAIERPLSLECPFFVATTPQFNPRPRRLRRRTRRSPPGPLRARPHPSLPLRLPRLRGNPTSQFPSMTQTYDAGIAWPGCGVLGSVRVTERASGAPSCHLRDAHARAAAGRPTLSRPLPRPRPAAALPRPSSPSPVPKPACPRSLQKRGKMIPPREGFRSRPPLGWAGGGEQRLLAGHQSD